MAITVDSDEHLYEPRGMWREHIDPALRDDALDLVDDEDGYTWLVWRGQQIQLADVHRPSDTDSCGEHRRRLEQGLPSSYDYDATLPASYWDPAARVAWLDEVGVGEAVCFPNFGLLWERHLSGRRPALTGNMTAWNRWCAAIRADSAGRLHPVAHLTLRDRAWLEVELDRLARDGVRLAMIAPAPVDGLPLSHPDLDDVWAAFVDHDIAPVFHVADQPRVLNESLYPQGDEPFVPAIESVFLWVPPALALTDLILNGTFDRHPRLRLGIVELSSIWVPQYLLMLDGGFDFTNRLNGRPTVELAHRPSEYVRQHVRVSSFCYEDPARLTRHCGDIFMACSDYPHSEGTADPLADYERAGCAPAERGGLFRGNVDFLLGR